MYERAFIKPRKIEYLRRKKEQDELAECHFTPKINNKSRILDMLRLSPKRRLSNERETNEWVSPSKVPDTPDRFNELYKDNDRR